MAVSLDRFVETDQSLIQQLYRQLQSLYASLQDVDSDVGPAATIPLDPLYEIAGRLGADTYHAAPSDSLAKTIHDLRGGGLTPLLGELQRIQMRGQSAGSHSILYHLTRDHLKIMRNALLGLDDPKREEDLQFKIHSTDLLAKKWQGAVFAGPNGPVTVQVRIAKSIAIAECCVEFGAVDRVLYNLFNNACRHTADGTVRLEVYPIPEESGPNLRFVLLNPVIEDHYHHLAQMDLQKLFLAGVSTTGSGYGLNVAADFVSNAFGLVSAKEAVREKYLGASLLQRSFAVWFHWPIVSAS